MSKEIEIKFKLGSEDFTKVKEKVSKIAKFVKKVNQIDEYFTPSHRNFMEPEYPFEYLSIRQRGGKGILNYKHFHPENVKEFTHCDELEFEIDSEGFRKMFSALNFRSLVVVEKEREIYDNSKFKICFDTVKELGQFIEIEVLKEFGNVSEIREKLFEFAKSLGIDISRADNRGYPYMLMKLKGSIK